MQKKFSQNYEKRRHCSKPALQETALKIWLILKPKTYCFPDKKTRPTLGHRLPRQSPTKNSNTWKTFQEEAYFAKTKLNLHILSFRTDRLPRRRRLGFTEAPKAGQIQKPCKKLQDVLFFVQEIFLFIISNHDVPSQRGVRSKGWSPLQGGKTCPNHLSINLYPKSSILKNFSASHRPLSALLKGQVERRRRLGGLPNIPKHKQNWLLQVEFENGSFFFSFETKSNRQNEVNGRDFLKRGKATLSQHIQKGKSSQKHKRWIAEIRPKVNPRSAKLKKARKRAKLANFSLSRGK